MPIYTKTGDNGTTGIYGGKRRSKADLQIEAYGSLDELSSFIGLVISKEKLEEKHLSLLKTIQKDLYYLMADLSGAKQDLNKLTRQIKFFEDEIDVQEKKLPALRGFISAQGTELSCLFHVLRTVCRRAERNIVRYSLDDEIILQYVNRLSDLFFVLARCYNKKPEKTL